MYINEAYFNHSRIDFKDKSRPLIVCNCGTYHLYSRPRIPTYRPRECQRLFKQMIQELQMCRDDYEEILALIFRELLINIHRQLQTDNHVSHNYLEKEAELSAKFFDENYNTEINIAEYAASKSMSTCWFIRNFKQVTGTTPMQYILSLRITNAQSLLESTDYNITEIGQIVGYDNPLYFSRIFKKQKGISPSEYRKQIRKAQES